MGAKKEKIRSDITEKSQPKKIPAKRKRYNKAYNHYKEHLKSKEFKEVRKIVINRDKCCRFCGRTEEELTLKNGKKLSWNIHHLPEGYKHLDDSPEEEAKYCILLDSSCHSWLHRNPSIRNRFTAMFTTKDDGPDDVNQDTTT